MPLIDDQRKARDHVHAWQTALPSQVIDSFSQLNPKSSNNSPQHPLLERVIAFEIDRDDLKTLAQESGSHLEINYGFNKQDLGGEQSAFKMLLRSVGGSGKNGHSEYYSLKSLTASNIKNDYPEVIKKSLFSHGIGNNVETINTSGEIPNEYISPTIEQWLFYAWRNCETAKLVDQVETMYQGSLVRIKKSVFAPNVSQSVLNYEDNSGNSTIYTFVLLALHQVIPGDRRIFPLGPILLSFIVPKGQELLSSNEAQSLEPESYELTMPCPPVC